jgi:hypothetical protein
LAFPPVTVTLQDATPEKLSLAAHVAAGAAPSVYEPFATLTWRTASPRS